MKRGLIAGLALLVAFSFFGCKEPDSGGSGGTTTVEKVTITFNANYGETPATATREIEKGKGIGTLYATAQGLTRPDHTFKEWYTNKEYTGSAVTATTPTFSAAATLYAKWDEDTVPLDPKPEGLAYDLAVTGAGTTLKMVDTEPKAYGSNYSSVNAYNEAGTENEDGSYTYDADSANYNGGGIVYWLPPATGSAGNATYNLSDYDLVEVFFKLSDDSDDEQEGVNITVKKGKSNNDLFPFPTDTNNNQYQTLGYKTGGEAGRASFRAVIAEITDGAIVFSRNGSSEKGPCTVFIEKVEFTKASYFTVTLEGGTNTGMTAIDPIKLPTITWDDDNDNPVTYTRPVNFAGVDAYKLARPRSDSNWTFDKWIYKADGPSDGDSLNPQPEYLAGAAFSASRTIKQDTTLTATWIATNTIIATPLPAAVDMETALASGAVGTVTDGNFNDDGEIDPRFLGAWGQGSLASSVYDDTDGTLTITLAGGGRENVFIPITTAQKTSITAIANRDVPGLVFKFTVADGKGVTESNGSNTGVRFSLINPLSGSGFNATAFGWQTFEGKVEKYLAWEAGKNAVPYINYLWIQVNGPAADTEIVISDISLELAELGPLNLDTAAWGTVPNSNSASGAPATNATAAMVSGKLQFTFNANNQRAVVPLTTGQIATLMAPANAEKQVKFTLNGAQTTGSNSNFRIHLADPAAGSSWNGTATGSGTLHFVSGTPVVETNAFANKNNGALGYLTIQLRDAGDSPNVVLQFDSITLELVYPDS